MMWNQSFLSPLFFLFVPFLTLAQKPELVPPISHAGNVSCVAVAPDGKYVLTGAGGKDNTAMLWSADGRLLKLLSHKNYITDMEYAPTGGHILSLEGETGDMRLWDSLGNLVWKNRSDDFFTDARFTPDGKFILAGHNSGGAPLRLYNLDFGVEFEFPTGNSTVNCVDISRNGNFIVAGSDDGTLRLYQSGQQEPLRKIALPNAEALKSVHFSPDGNTVLIGGDRGTVTLWNTGTGTLKKIPGLDFDYKVRAAWSPNGAFIAAGSELEGNVYLYNNTTSEIKVFKAIQFAIHTLVFTPDNRSLIVGGLERGAKKFDLSGPMLVDYSTAASPVTSVGFSQDNRFILTGGEGQHVRLWNTVTGNVDQFKSGEHYNAPSVFETGDSALVIGASGRYNQRTVFDSLKTGTKKEIKKPFLGTSRAIAFHPAGPYLLTSDFKGSAYLCRASDGTLIKEYKVSAGNFTSLAFSPDGAYFVAGYSNKFTPSVVSDGFNVSNTGDPNPATLYATGENSTPLRTYGGWADQVAFSPDGKMLAANDSCGVKIWKTDDGSLILHLEETFAMSLAFAPDNHSILIGYSDNDVKRYSLETGNTGKLMAKYKRHYSAIRSVAFSSDGKYIITGSSDNTSKIWWAATGEEIITLIAVNNSDWVAITPDGLFDASPGAMKDLYFVYNLEVIELDQLKERYYEPGLLQKVFGHTNDGIREVAVLAEVPLYPLVKASVRNDTLLDITLEPRSGGLGKLSLFQNGKELEEDINPERTTSLSIDLKPYGRFFEGAANNVTLGLRAYNADNWLKSPAVEISYQPSFVASRGETSNTNATPQRRSLGAPKPELYAILVGTSDYKGSSLDLRFPDLDAIAMNQAIGSSSAELFGPDRVHLRLLTSKAENPADISSKENIQAAFQAFADQARAGDIIVLYFSGHGVTYGAAEKGQFYYLTRDIGSTDLKDPEVRNQAAVSSDELTQWLSAIPAQKQVLILDACNSGKIVESLAGHKDLNSSQIRALERMKDRTGMYILTGSAADMVSYEASQYGQGLLTYSLLQGMNGMALKDKNVDVSTLFQHARDVVPGLARDIGGVQIPVLATPAGDGSFDIGTFNSNVKIPVAKVKPVIIRNSFQDEDNFVDVLGFNEHLDDYLRRLTAKGAEADMIYVDVPELPNAYSITGRYKVQGAKVILNCGLFEGNKLIEKFSLEGKTDAVPQLVQNLMDNVFPLLKI